jgi:hypothetical protein
MARAKSSAGKRGVRLSGYVDNVTSAIHAGVSGALQKSVSRRSGGPGKGATVTAADLGPRVNPKVIYVTVSFAVEVDSDD